MSSSLKAALGGAVSVIALSLLLVATGRISVTLNAPGWEQLQEDGLDAGLSLRQRRLASDFRSAFGLFGAETSAHPLDDGITNLNNKATLQAFNFGPEKFKKLAYSVVAPLQPTDKVTTHTYQTMYGIFLYPLLARARKYQQRLKFFEIGIGCGMTYGPGRSVALWKGLFGDSISLWEADLDPNCVKRMQDEGQLNGVNMLVGNQKNPEHLKRWLVESQGAFDVIIDDGGHMNHEIKVLHTSPRLHTALPFYLAAPPCRPPRSRLL